MSETSITRKMFAFSKTLKSTQNNPAKKFTDYSLLTQNNIKRKYKGPLGKEYKINLKKAKAAAKAKNLEIQKKRTVKPGQGKFSLPSQKPGSVKPPTIKPASSTMKIKAPAPKEKKVGGDKGRWLDHVDKFRKENPSMSYKEVLTEAKKTYVSVKKIKAPKKQVGVVKAPEPGTTEKKPRKLNKKQLELRFNREPLLRMFGKDKFEEWYNTNIKGKRFKDNAEIEAKLKEFVDSVRDPIEQMAIDDSQEKKAEKQKVEDKVISDVKEAVGEKGANIIFSNLLFSSERDFADKYTAGSGPRWGSKLKYQFPQYGDLSYGTLLERSKEIAEDPRWSVKAVEIAKKYKKLDGYLGKSAGDWLEEYQKEGQNIKTGKTGNVITWNPVGDAEQYDDSRRKAGGTADADGRGGYTKGMRRQNRSFDKYNTIEEFYQLIRSQMKKDKKKKKKEAK